jgi:hypothetical protein
MLRAMKWSHHMYLANARAVGGVSHAVCRSEVSDSLRARSVVVSRRSSDAIHSAQITFDTTQSYQSNELIECSKSGCGMSDSEQRTAELVVPGSRGEE